MQYVLIASRGSSSNAARYAQYLLGRAHRVPVMFATPSLYTIYEQPPRLDGAAVIGISQSGASPDVASVLAEARRQGRPTIALTNDVDSPLAREADAVLAARGGRGARRRGDEDVHELARRGRAALRGGRRRRWRRPSSQQMPEMLERQIALSLETAPPLDEYADAIGATVVGRGVNYGTAFEIALKIRELSGLVVEAYSPADLMHGPIAAIQPGWPVVVVAPSGPARPSVEDVVLPLRERGARLIAVSDVAAVLRRAQTRLPLVPRVPGVAQPADRGDPGPADGAAARAAARARHRRARRAATRSRSPAERSRGA